MTTSSVPHDIFQQAIGAARAASATIRDATSPSGEYPRFGATYYLTADSLSGYGVLDDGTLVGLFSLVRGRGASLMANALDDGARTLDCFDGFLVDFYGRHGFVESHRATNWEGADEPDVVWMKLSEETSQVSDPSSR